MARLVDGVICSLIWSYLHSLPTWSFTLMFALSCIFTAVFTTGFYYDGNRHVKAVEEYEEEV